MGFPPSAIRQSDQSPQSCLDRPCPTRRAQICLGAGWPHPIKLSMSMDCVHAAGTAAIASVTAPSIRPIDPPRRTLLLELAVARRVALDHAIRHAHWKGSQPLVLCLNPFSGPCEASRPGRIAVDEAEQADRWLVIYAARVDANREVTAQLRGKRCQLWISCPTRTCNLSRVLLHARCWNRSAHQ